LIKKFFYLGEEKLNDNVVLSNCGGNAFELRAEFGYNTAACSVCMTDETECFITPCGHFYCDGCFIETFLTELEKGNTFRCEVNVDDPKESGLNTCEYEFNVNFLNCFGDEYQIKIGETLNTLAMRRLSTKICPRCRIDCVRNNEDVRLRCNTRECKRLNERDFCWYCGFTWLQNNSSVTCGNGACIGEDPLLKAIRECPETTLRLYPEHPSTVKVEVKVPSMRLCPHCSAPYFHTSKYCKMIHGCTSCKKGWCFACLRPEKLENQRRVPTCSAGPYDVCKFPIAPRQTKYHHN